MFEILLSHLPKPCGWTASLAKALKIDKIDMSIICQRFTLFLHQVINHLCLKNWWFDNMQYVGNCMKFNIPGIYIENEFPCLTCSFLEISLWSGFPYRICVKLFTAESSFITYAIFSEPVLGTRLNINTSLSRWSFIPKILMKL